MFIISYTNNFSLYLCFMLYEWIILHLMNWKYCEWIQLRQKWINSHWLKEGLRLNKLRDEISFHQSRANGFKRESSFCKAGWHSFFVCMRCGTPVVRSSCAVYLKGKPHYKGSCHDEVSRFSIKSEINLS